MPHLRIRTATTIDPLTIQNATIIVAEQNQLVIGSAVLLANARTSVVRLYSISVAEHARGNGVARKLLDEALRRAEHAGAMSFRLETRLDNTNAQHLFESAGFKPFEQINCCYEDGVRAIQYHRTLVAASQEC